MPVVIYVEWRWDEHEDPRLKIFTTVRWLAATELNAPTSFLTSMRIDTIEHYEVLLFEGWVDLFPETVSTISFDQLPISLSKYVLKYLKRPNKLFRRGSVVSCLTQSSREQWLYSAWIIIKQLVSVQFRRLYKYYCTNPAGAIDSCSYGDTTTVVRSDGSRSNELCLAGFLRSSVRAICTRT